MLKALSITLALLIFAAVANLKLAIQNQGTPASEKATPIQANVKSVKQKILGRLFQNHKTSRKLPDLVKSGTGEVTIKSIVYPPFIKGVAGCPSYPRQDLTSYSHQADAVIVGSINDKLYSQLTEDNDFIFSEYDLNVESIIKNNRSSPIEQGTIISIVRPGGRVSLNGREVQAIAGAFKPFVKGERYLLFLRYVPQTGSYLAYGSGSFHLSNNQVEELASGNRFAGEPDAFIAETRAAITATPCANRVLY